MPPKLKLQRATVHPEFVETMQAMYAEWITKNDRLIRAGTKNSNFAHFTHSARRMFPIVKGISNDRAGLDYEITRLRGLPYTDFTVIRDVDPSRVPDLDGWDYEEDGEPDLSDVPIIPWLVGRTKFVVMTNYANRGEIMGQLGHFDVCIPSSIVRSPEIGHIHMIPHRNYNSINRHPHHGIQVGDSVRHTPRLYPTINCYGDYSGIIKGMVDEPDFPELFRQLFGHLSTFGFGPPISLSSLDYDITTPER